tara:strand:- start:106 stop:282 length:177 start_codon:yes stop_codon:yes gene_type:complete
MEKKATRFLYCSNDLERMTEKQIETDIAVCYQVLKELKKEQKQRLDFDKKLQEFKQFI